MTSIGLTLRTMTAMLALAAVGLTPTLAQSQTTAPAAATTTDKPKEPQKDPKVEEYEKAVKDLKKYEGNVVLYARKKEILIELPESKLGEILLVQPSFHSGFLADSITAGFPINFGSVSAFKFVRNEETVTFVRPNIQYRWDKENPLALASERSFPEAILGSFRIEASNPEKKVLLVNVTSLFTPGASDIFRIGEMVQMLLGGPYSVDRERSGPELLKSHPENTYVRMFLHFSSPRVPEENPLMALMGMAAPQLEDGRSAPLKVAYNLWWRKPSDYRPRQADPRVGYFTTDYFSVDRFEKQDRVERLINRWNLKKKDPSAKLSEPVKPIVWTIDPSIPAKFRQSTKEGILYWNRAFEALGYKNAVVVQDAPTDGSYDHTDARFNVVRWTMSEDAGYAIALFQTDPFTGEILNASVNMDANMASFSDTEYKFVTTPGAPTMRRSLQIITDEWLNKQFPCQEDAYLWDGEKALAEARMRAYAKKIGREAHACAYAHEKRADAIHGWQALKATTAGRPKIAIDRYINDFVRDVTSHEVGHCMGLRHNFIASRLNSTKDLANDQTVNERGITSSVMEYTPTNSMAILKGSGVFFAPKVGPYDMWAIEYGYMDTGASTVLGDKPVLSRIASNSGSPGNRFMTDENADSFDPYVVRFDMASDGLGYSKANFEIAKRMRNYAIQNLPRSGTSYAERTQMLLMSMQSTFREGRMAIRYIGGTLGSRSFAGDRGAIATLRPVSPEEHREAARLITQYLLQPDSFALPESVLSNMSVDHTYEGVSGWTAPLRQLISSNANALFAQLMSASRINALAENNYKWQANPKAYTIHEHYALILNAVFADLESANLTPLRRDLHRFAVTALMTQASAGPGAVAEDARLLANDWLRRLGSRYKSASTKKSATGMNGTYLRETSAQIDRFLKRSVVGN